ncbi:hypothetical protein D3C79_669080 [compost metagenome]
MECRAIKMKGSCESCQLNLRPSFQPCIRSAFRYSPTSRLSHTFSSPPLLRCFCDVLGGKHGELIDHYSTFGDWIILVFPLLSAGSPGKSPDSNKCSPSGEFINSSSSLLAFSAAVSRECNASLLSLMMLAAIAK